MKKTLIIAIVIVVVCVILYFVLGNKKSPNEKQESEAEREARLAQEKATAEADARQNVINAYNENRSTEILDQSTTENQLKSAGVVRTEAELKEQATLANRYNELTGLRIGSELSLEDLRLEVAQLETAKTMLEKIKNAFPESRYDVNYSTELTLANALYDSYDELEQKYNSLVARDSEIQKMAAEFMFDLQDGIIWSDDARPTKKAIGAILTGGLSLFKNSDTDKNALFKSYRAWNGSNIEKILALTAKESRLFEDYLKQSYTDFYYRVEKPNATLKSKYNRKNAYSYNEKSGLKKDNFTMEKLLTYNGQDSKPHETGYFRERDEKSGVDYSILLFNKFKGQSK